MNTADDARNAVLTRYAAEVGNDPAAIAEINAADVVIVATRSYPRYGRLNVTLSVELVFADGGVAVAADPVVIDGIRTYGGTADDTAKTINRSAKSTYPALVAAGIPVVIK